MCWRASWPSVVPHQSSKPLIWTWKWGLNLEWLPYEIKYILLCAELIIRRLPPSLRFKTHDVARSLNQLQLTSVAHLSSKSLLINLLIHGKTIRTHYMTAVQLAVALCVLATMVNGCTHHDGALVADSTAQIPTPANKRSLLSTAQSNGTLIVRKCGVAPTSDFRKQAIQLRVQPHIAARAASAERTMKATNVNVYVTINRNGGTSANK